LVTFNGKMGWLALITIPDGGLITLGISKLKKEKKKKK
jgi:hypothetical protein